jgi:hypothetical protein
VVKETKTEKYEQQQKKVSEQKTTSAQQKTEPVILIFLPPVDTYS